MEFHDQSPCGLDDFMDCVLSFGMALVLMGVNPGHSETPRLMSSPMAWFDTDAQGHIAVVAWEIKACGLRSPHCL